MQQEQLTTDAVLAIINRITDDDAATRHEAETFDNFVQLLCWLRGCNKFLFYASQVDGPIEFGMPCISDQYDYTPLDAVVPGYGDYNFDVEMRVVDILTHLLTLSAVRNSLLICGYLCEGTEGEAAEYIGVRADAATRLLQCGIRMIVGYEDMSNEVGADVDLAEVLYFDLGEVILMI